MIAVTGATGFLGADLVARLLRTTAEPVVALVRAEDDEAAQVRLDAALAPLGVFGARAIAGDVTDPATALPGAVTAVVHCAADVAFDRPLDEARAINVDGTRNVLAAAQRLPRLDRFVHVSTAFVSGRHPGTFGEHDGDLGQTHRNTYEQTKLEAELVVRASNLPVCVVRPSIVVGDSLTGWTSSFNVLYFPLQAYARGLVTRIPGDPSALVDIVPVDHVTDVIVAALAPSCPHQTLHAVAGEAAPTAGELAALASRVLGRPPIEFGTATDLADALDVYFPYFTVRGHFDATRARALGLRPPRLEDYFDRLIDYANLTRWGRRPISV